MEKTAPKSKLRKPKRMFSWMNPKLEVRDTKKYGKGVFAKENIKKDDTLFVMGGYILTIEDDNNIKEKSILDKAIEISDYFFIGPLQRSDLDLMPEHYLNHNCDPNAGFKGHLFFVAIKNIKRGEEITFDYAMCMNPDERSNTYFKMECLCGSKRCRGYITEDDWEIPAIQKKYNGYFQYFLQEKINKNKGRAKKMKRDTSYQLKPPPWEK